MIAKNIIFEIVIKSLIFDKIFQYEKCWFLKNNEDCLFATIAILYELFTFLSLS